MATFTSKSFTSKLFHPSTSIAQIAFKVGALASSLVVSSVSYGVEGYPDNYLDREKDIYIQGIVCGDFNNPRSLKPSAVYTNAENIPTGTYYFSSKYGNFSYTFAPLDGQPAYVMKRGLLRAGQTDKSQMVIDLCIVDDVPSLPAPTRKNLTQTKLTPDASNWDKTMEQYALITGRPAFGPDAYENPRAAMANANYDQQVYDANQAYLKAAQAYFDAEAERMASELPKKLENAIKYAHQEDGFLKNKTYTKVEKPLVWTPTSEKRYEDAMHRLHTEQAFDQVIQQNFDWLFALVGKENGLSSTSFDSQQKSQWNENVLERVITAKAKFDDGKELSLDFVVRSEKVDVALFDSLEMINKKSNSARNSMIVGAKKERPLVNASDANSLDVYSPTEKVHLFFSPFRMKPVGDTYRYQ